MINVKDPTTYRTAMALRKEHNKAHHDDKQIAFLSQIPTYLVGGHNRYQVRCPTCEPPDQTGKKGE